MLRRVLGLALAGTAAWLVWVLAGRIGSTGALAVGGLAASAVAGLAGRLWMPRRAGRPAAAAAALALAAFLVPANPPVDVRPPAEDVWQPFEPERIAALVAQGHTVFVNVTADWCLTCKVNERLVLSRDPVRSGWRARVVAMRGDWTSGRRHRALSRRIRSLRNSLRCRLRPGVAKRRGPTGIAERGCRDRRARARGGWKNAAERRRSRSPLQSAAKGTHVSGDSPRGGSAKTRIGGRS